MKSRVTVHVRGRDRSLTFDVPKADLASSLEEWRTKGILQQDGPETRIYPAHTIEFIFIRDITE